jgi:hypothetical protein
MKTDWPAIKKIQLALVREFKYVYCAVAPADGETAWMASDQMNTESMGKFMEIVSNKFPNDLISMVVDGAGSQKAKAHGIHQLVWE